MGSRLLTYMYYLKQIAGWEVRYMEDPNKLQSYQHSTYTKAGASLGQYNWSFNGLCCLFVQFVYPR